MLLARLGIDDLYGLVSTGQTFPDEGKQYAILFVVVGEEGTNMTYSAEMRAGERNRPQRRRHLLFLPREVVLRAPAIAQRSRFMSDFPAPDYRANSESCRGPA